MSYLTVGAVVLLVVLSIEIYKLQYLTRNGVVASFLMESFVDVFSSINTFFLLTIFIIARFIATMKDFNKKTKEGFQDGNRGECA